MKGNLLYGQSGGPTSVINSSAAGVFLEALQHSDQIEKVYGAHHGIVGVLNEDFFDMGQEDPEEIALLLQTPASFLGSCRYKLQDPESNGEAYKRILEVFKKYNIRYFFYNGGNDSMDTCLKVDLYLKAHGYECRVIGVPKTIDNDLAVTDHCPGYGSAARYIATTVMEIAQDAVVYDKGQITVIEVMGRNAGWLTAACAIPGTLGQGVDLIYLPERPFVVDRVLEDIQKVYEQKGKVIVAISEGIKTPDGELLTSSSGGTDSFGHAQLGGAAQTLVNIIKERGPKVKLRAIELSLMQRCGAHLASRQDVEDAFNAGRSAVRAALNDRTGVMIGFRRPETGLYHTEIVEIPLSEVANAEKKVPDSWINSEGNGLTQEFVQYAKPLLEGTPECVRRNALPCYPKFKFVQAGSPVTFVQD